MILSQISKVGNELSGVAFAAQAEHFAPLKECALPQVRNALGAIFTQHAILVGIKGKMSTLLKDDITALVTSRFATLSLEEIYKAFQMERYGDFLTPTEHYGLLNAPYVSAVLKKYVCWLQQTRQEHHLKRAPNTNETQHKPAPYTCERFLVVWNEVVQKYQQDGSLPLFTSWIYDCLCQFILIDEFTPEEKQLLQERFLLERAKEKVPKNTAKGLLRHYFSSPTDEISLKKRVALEYILEQQPLRPLNNEKCPTQKN